MIFIDRSVVVMPVRLDLQLVQCLLSSDSSPSTTSSVKDSSSHVVIAALLDFLILLNY
jgi:hypothetical protein